MTNSTEGNKHIFENFLLNELLPLLTPGGVWVAPNPAPLTAAEVTEIFERVAMTEKYKAQHMTTATHDRQVVVLMNGVIHTEAIEGTPFENAAEIFERGA